MMVAKMIVQNCEYIVIIHFIFISFTIDAFMFNILKLCKEVVYMYFTCRKNTKKLQNFQSVNFPTYKIHLFLWQVQCQEGSPTQEVHLPVLPIPQQDILLRTVSLHSATTREILSNIFLQF